MNDTLTDARFIGQRIKELRSEKGITQKELGILLDATENSVSKWERGVVYIPVDRLLDIARLFDVNCEELLPTIKSTNPFNEQIYKYPTNNFKPVKDRYPDGTKVVIYERDMWPDIETGEVLYRLRSLSWNCGQILPYIVKGYECEYNDCGYEVPYINLVSCDTDKKIRHRLKISSITDGQYYLRRVNMAKDIPISLPYKKNQWILDAIEYKTYAKQSESEKEFYK